MTQEKTALLDASADDRKAIDALVRAFFDAFTNKDRKPNLRLLQELSIPEGIYIKNCGDAPEICGLSQFLAPRAKLLTEGALTNFEEAEISSRTDVCGNVAQRICIYRKSGVLSGTRFEARGVKTFQFIRTSRGWKISAVAWDDERAGLKLPDDIRFV